MSLRGARSAPKSNLDPQTHESADQACFVGFRPPRNDLRRRCSRQPAARGSPQCPRRRRRRRRAMPRRRIRRAQARTQPPARPLPLHAARRGANTRGRILVRDGRSRIPSAPSADVCLKPERGNTAAMPVLLRVPWRTGAGTKVPSFDRQPPHRAPALRVVRARPPQHAQLLHRPHPEGSSSCRDDERLEGRGRPIRRRSRS